MSSPHEPHTTLPALPITSAPFTVPYETPVIRIGRGGLNLVTDPDQLPPEQCTYFVNVDVDEGSVQARAGETLLTTTAAGTVTGISRLDRPKDGTFLRFVGKGQVLYAGNGPILNVLGNVAGLSGDPITLLPHRPPQSGEAWMFFADRTVMGMVRADGVQSGLGRTPPAAPGVALGLERTQLIAQFDASDATAAASWSATAGEDSSTTPIKSGVPTASDITGKSGNAVLFKTTIGLAKSGYSSFWGKGKNLDLSKLSDGANSYTATDDDLVHLWLRLDNPTLIDEVRIYLVCADNFNPGVLPGTASDGNSNQDFYVKTFRADAFTSFVAGKQSQDAAASVARDSALNDDDLRRRRIAGRTPLETEVFGPGPDDDRTSWTERRASVDPARRRSVEAGAAVGQWLEYGVIGTPLRRGDFQRIGSTSGRDWSTLTGIIVWVKTNTNKVVALALDQMYLTGGADVDTSEPGAMQLDYKVTTYDTLTGIESNGSVVSATIDTARRPVQLTSGAVGDPGIRQRYYRRGGSNTDNWYFVAQSASDGFIVVDTFSDEATIAAGTVPIDHYKAVPTVDSNGATVLGQPVPGLWGPVNGMLFACGDPYRPGHLYWCLPDAPGHWPADFNYEVCAPSEQLMNGCVWGDQPWVFSRKRLYAVYPNLTGTAGQVTVNPTTCEPGLASRWLLAVTPYGIAYGHETGIYLTTGGKPDELSELIRPLFRGQTKGDRKPIDFTHSTGLTLTYAAHRLYLTYFDSAGARRMLIYSFLFKYWRAADFGKPISRVGTDGNSDTVLLGGAATGALYYNTGTSDDGTPIVAHLRTGDWDLGRPREDKLLGDIILDADVQQTSLTVQARINNSQTTDQGAIAPLGVGRQRYGFTPFGTVPQRARNVSLDLSWSAADKRPVVYFAGVSVIPEPDSTTTRATQWDDCGSATEKFLYGVMIECDTYAADRPLVIEGTLNNATVVLYTGTVNTPARRRLFLTWPAAAVQLVRIRPTDPNAVCPFWILYRCAWLADIEPPRIAGWDTNWQSNGDTYYTGLDLECDTFGLAKTVQLYVDQVLIDTFQVTANGRRLVHLTVTTPGRGHLYRFVATDVNPGLLYAYKWHLDGEPSEQANWNQNYTIAGSLSDKYLKGVLLECDTYGVDKTVQVQVDGVTVETLTVNTNGRKVLHLSFPQHGGRVFRLLPTDVNLSRLYSMEWLFDEEPYALARWETQETDHGIGGWQIPLDADITLKSTGTVTLTLTVYGQSATPRTLIYLIPSTFGVKVANFVPFEAVKGRLFKYVLTAVDRFTLYRDESVVRVGRWGVGGQLQEVRPFGNDDIQGRPMNHAARLATAANTGGAGQPAGTEL